MKNIMRKKMKICPDVTSPDDMEKGVGDEKDDNTERLDEENESTGPNDNPHIDMEESVDDEKDDNTEKT